MRSTTRNSDNLSLRLAGVSWVPALALWILTSSSLLSGCVVKSRCYADRDCPGEQICGAEGRCSYICERDADCGQGFRCEAHVCKAVALQKASCPQGMLLVAEAFCVDRYEASRVDATLVSAGHDDQRATSRGGVLPWKIKNNAAATKACAASGKRLCTATEWELACEGSEGTVYGYGDAYNPTTCNGIDAFCDCASPGCASLKTCPYTHCYSQASVEGGGPCGASFHLMPTGSFPNCVNSWGIFDMNGNLWEHVQGGNDTTIRGGAYNCGDSKTLHRCAYVPGTWSPSARGFRCCADATVGAPLTDASGSDTSDDEVDSGKLEDVQDATGQRPPILDVESELGGCIDEDAGGLDAGGELDAGDASVDASALAPDAALDVATLDVAAQDAGASDAQDASTADAQTKFDVLDTSNADAPLPDTTAPDATVLDAKASDATVLDAKTSDTPTSDTGAPPAPCPSEMAIVGSWCVDRYEAAHADATKFVQGSAAKPISEAGILPWFPVTLSQAKAACETVGKRLCKPSEWESTCQGAKKTKYVYGDAYNATTCNGIDAFCGCATGSCAALKLCPYPHCNGTASAEGGGPCPAAFHVVPTGSFSACVNAQGVFDLNGNVWEIVDAGDGQEHFRGGAYNCGNSEMLHACTYDATWGPSARGFRCCRDQQVAP